MNYILHLAIPANNIGESIEFYLKLDAILGRKTTSWAIFNFFNLQLVLHKNKNFDVSPSMYPRHFGVILNEERFNYYHDLSNRKNIKFFKKCFERYAGEIAEHKTFFLCDPANNTIEFKWYRQTSSIFG